MKKNILIVALCIGIVISFFLGYYTNSLLHNSVGNGVDKKTEEKALVGVYETDSWNGKSAVLVLYEDGTSQYPSGGTSTWTIKDNVVLFTVSGLGYDNGKQAITAYFDSDVQEAEMESISQTIRIINNVEYVNLLVDEYQQRIYIKLIQDDENNEVYNAIKAIEGVRSAEYEYREIETFSEHEAKIMENGLILHGKFFIKVSD